MKRALLLGLAWTLPAAAQPADWAARPDGPTLPLEVWIGIDGRPGMPAKAHGAAKLKLGDVPSGGSTCASDVPPPDDVLHGAPVPHGLLRGDGPRDVLHNRPTGSVTIEPAPPR